MHSLSGLVLDVYDDVGGTVLRDLYPSLGDIPETVKTAHVVTGDDRGSLPDDVFALVLVNNGEKLRKFACVDKGNTILSVQYFLKNAHKLPAEAQRVGAENLQVACGWYDLTVPEPLAKMAGVQTALTLMNAAPIIKGTHQAIKENVGATRDLGRMGNDIVTPHMRDQYLGRKHAEVNGSPDMPLQPPGSLSKPGAPKAVIAKTAMGRLVTPSKGDTDVEPDVVHPPMAEQKGSLPQAKHMKPTVDVSNQEPPTPLVEKKASIFALPDEQRYPLDSYAQVKAADAYFEKYASYMPPPTRRDYATNLIRRAEDLAFDTCDLVRKYGAGTFAPEEEIKAAFDARRIEVAHHKDALSLLGEVEKVARFRMWKEASADTPRVYEPHEVVELLAEFDKVAGLDHKYDRGIPDPYYSIYGFEKSAEEAAFSEVIGNDTVTAADLKRLARIGAHGVKTTFGMEFQEEFLKDPVGIFKSMPLDQKKMLMRMANSTQPGAERNY